MATALEVANQALLLLGEGLITQGQLETPDDDTSRAVGGMLDLSRKAVLRDMKPGCARRYAELTLAPDPPPFVPDFSFLYELPEDYLRVLALFYGEENALLAGSGLPLLTRYRITGGFIGADEDMVSCEYIYDAPITALDSLASEALAAYLAWKLAFTLTESTTKQQSMASLYGEMKRQAESADRSEGYKNQIRDGGTLAASRHRGGF